MHPRPAARTADEERASVLHRQVVNRVRLVREKGLVSKQQLTSIERLAGLRLCPMPRHALHTQQWSRPADNACPNAQAASIQPCPLYRLPTLLSVPLLPTLLDQFCD